MRTLALLAAFLLLAFQARAQTLQETADQVPAQEQPGGEDQDQPGDEDQDVTVSFTGEERLARGAAVRGRIRCECRRTRACNFLERNGGNCRISGRRYKLCCH